eukprot:UN27362
MPKDDLERREGRHYKKCIRSGYDEEQYQKYLQKFIVNGTIETEALVLEPPKIEFMGARNKLIKSPVTSFRWAATAGVTGECRVLKQWAICYHTAKMKRAAENVLKLFEQYMKKRGFKYGDPSCPFAIPQVRYFDYSPGNLKKLQSDCVKPGDQAIMLILPNHMAEGGQIKINVTNALHRAENTNNPVVIQCIKQSNAE